jgi:malate dehydrogenase (oxaloacetate-decarboxylating)(NADP+)
MEGKACLFKKFADIDVFDLEINEHDTDKLVDIIASLEPTFGGINLEDIAAPACFEIEEKLRARMRIPVFHDDQHGTAIITGAGLLNACQISGRKPADIKLVVSGAGAAAIACVEFYVSLGVKKEQVVLVDSKGVIHQGRTDLNSHKAKFAIPDDGRRTLADAMRGADMFMGLSVANIVTPEMLKTMADRPIVFALANPDPEIGYTEAKAARPDAIVATGRSDFPNQINNVLAFPGVFRGALDADATVITDTMKIAAAFALADYVLEPTPERILPDPLDKAVAYRIGEAVAYAAVEGNVCREPRRAGCRRFVGLRSSAAGRWGAAWRRSSRVRAFPRSCSR